MCPNRLPLSEKTRNQIFPVKNQDLFIWNSRMWRISVETYRKSEIFYLISMTLFFVVIRHHSCIVREWIASIGFLNIWLQQNMHFASRWQDDAPNDQKAGFWPGRSGFWSSPTAAIDSDTWERSGLKFIDLQHTFKKNTFFCADGNGIPKACEAARISTIVTSVLWFQ